MQVLVQILIGVLSFYEGSIFRRAQLVLSLIAVVLMALILYYGENPGDEKGCLMQSIHPWICYVIGVYVLLTALNKFPDHWGIYRQKKSKERTPLLPLSNNQKRRR